MEHNFGFLYVPLNCDAKMDLLPFWFAGSLWLRFMLAELLTQ
jgi:hypothetical protein